MFWGAGMIQWQYRNFLCKNGFLARLAVVVMSSVVSVGCEQTFAKPRTSADIETKALGIFLSARSNGIVTQVFVEALDNHGIIELGPTDQFLITIPGQADKKFVDSSAGTIAEIPGDKTSFSIVLVRKGKRFTTQVEMPPRFSLEAHYDEKDRSSSLSILTNWTPSAPDSTMSLTVGGPKGYYTTTKDVEGADGSWSLSESELKLREYGEPWRSLPRETIVIATRTGGKVTLDPALAAFPHAGKLEQIRTTVVGPPPPLPPAQVATDPAQ